MIEFSQDYNALGIPITGDFSEFRLQELPHMNIDSPPITVFLLLLIGVIYWWHRLVNTTTTEQ
jgi:hypothetical protein